jgi:hypothetical protein
MVDIDPGGDRTLQLSNIARRREKRKRKIIYKLVIFKSDMEGAVKRCHSRLPAGWLAGNLRMVQY